jgi:hypothetical protein
MTQAVKLAERHGFKATRRKQKIRKVESGCSLVRTALARLGVHLTEDRIKQIWRPRKRGALIRVN